MQHAATPTRASTPVRAAAAAARATPASPPWPSIPVASAQKARGWPRTGITRGAAESSAPASAARASAAGTGTPVGSVIRMQAMRRLVDKLYLPFSRAAAPPLGRLHPRRPAKAPSRAQPRPHPRAPELQLHVGPPLRAGVGGDQHR